MFRGLHPLQVLIYPDRFTVPTVSQSQPSARMLIYVAEGISAFNVTLVTPASDGGGYLSVNLFSNRIACFSFYPIFLIFGLRVHNNIEQKPMELDFWLQYFSDWTLITKTQAKKWILWGFWPFSQRVFTVWPCNLVYRHIGGTSRCM